MSWRAAALGQRGDGFAHGLAVICGRGVAAWMRLQAAAPARAMSPPAAPPAAVAAGLARAPAAQIVTILAAMTLAAATARDP